MENPVKYMENKDREMVKTIGETGGWERLPQERILLRNCFTPFLLEKKGNEIQYYL